ncbi:MAG: hypothetical protein WKF87_09155 [Chryseolinea sp.]
MKSFTSSSCVILALICCNISCPAQDKNILVDVAHGQKFYSDPADNISSDLVPMDRLEYMTRELTKNGTAKMLGSVI